MIKENVLFSDLVLPFTVVGSYQSDSVQKALEAQTRANVDFPSTGQPYVSMSASMALPYLEVVKGISIQEYYNNDKMIRILKKISPQEKDKIKESEIFKEVEDALKLKKMKNEINYFGLKAIITGPNTALREIPPVGIPDVYSGKREELLEDLANAFVEIANIMIVDDDVKILQIDEPIFSRYDDKTEIIKDEFKVMSRMFLKIKKENAETKTALHVCGEISEKLYSYLVKIEGLDILDHEFAEFPRNFNIINKNDLIDNDKCIGVGVVSNNKKEVESEEEIRSIVKRAMELYGEDRIFVKPDCGLSRISVNVADSKLIQISKVLEGIRTE